MIHDIPGIIKYQLDRGGTSLRFEVLWQHPDLRSTSSGSEDVPKIRPTWTRDAPLGEDYVFGVESQAYPELREEVIYLQGHRRSNNKYDGETAVTMLKSANEETAISHEKTVIRSIAAWAKLPACARYFKGVYEPEQIELFE